MRKHTALPLRWARDCALLALALSLLALLLPARWGGYPGWDDAALVTQNLASIIARMAIFALVAGAVGSFWSRARQRRRGGGAPPRHAPQRKKAG